MTLVKDGIGTITLAAAAGAAAAIVGTVLVLWRVPKVVVSRSQDKESRSESLRDNCECGRDLKEGQSPDHRQTEYRKRLDVKEIVGEVLEAGGNRGTKKSDLSGLAVAATGAALLSWGLLKVLAEEKGIPNLQDIPNLHPDEVQEKKQANRGKDDERSTSRGRKHPDSSAADSTCPSKAESSLPNPNRSAPLQISENSSRYKLNFDGSDRKQKGQGGGIIIRDETGEPIVAAAYNLSELPPPVNIGVIEATALIEGLKLARTMRIDSLNVEGDSAQVINSIQGTVKVRPMIQDLVQQIKTEMEKFKKVQIGHVPRKENGVAHALAKLGTEIKEDGVWYGREKLPVQVANLVEQEIAAVAGERI